jgi:hypothetical protein
MSEHNVLRTQRRNKGKKTLLRSCHVQKCKCKWKSVFATTNKDEKCTSSYFLVPCYTSKSTVFMHIHWIINGLGFLRNHKTDVYSTNIAYETHWRSIGSSNCVTSLVEAYFWTFSNVRRPKSKNTLRLMLINHRQKPTEVIYALLKLHDGCCCRTQRTRRDYKQWSVWIHTDTHHTIDSERLRANYYITPHQPFSNYQHYLVLFF